MTQIEVVACSLNSRFPPSATNSEGYLDLRTFGFYSGAYTNEVFAYTGDGSATIGELSAARTFVATLPSRYYTNQIQIDLTAAIREHAGGYLGVWIDDQPIPDLNPIFYGRQLTTVSDVKVELLSDAIDEPTTARWLYPPKSKEIPFFEPMHFYFQIVDPDSRVTSVELHSTEAGLLAKFDGLLLLGTNQISFTWTNPIPGLHSLFLVTSNEDNVTATIPLGQLTVDSIAAQILSFGQPDSPPGVPATPAPNPFPVYADVLAGFAETVEAELSLTNGEVLDRRFVNLTNGENFITLFWTNPIPGEYVFQLRLTDSSSNSTTQLSPTMTVFELDHQWLDQGNNIASIHLIDAAGRIRIMGYNGTGELGLGYSPTEWPHGLISPATLPPPPGLRWKQVASFSPSFFGPQTFVALADNGSLYGWGYNPGGLFSPMTTNQTRLKAPIQILPNEQTSWWRTIAVGPGVVGAIDQNQDFWSWGPNIPPSPTPGPWLDVKCAGTNFVLLSTDGQLGTMTMPSGVKATRAYAVCATHGLAIGDDGQLYAWGENRNGQLPISNLQSSSQPVLADPLPGVSAWTHVAAATNLSLAVDSNGRLYSWGSSTNSGSRNPVQNKPTLVDIPETGWLDIAVNPLFALALSQRGNLYVWGSIFAANVGNKTTFQYPTRVQDLSSLLDSTFQPTMATFDSGGLLNGSDLALKVIAPVNTALQLQYSSDFQTWQTLSNFVTTSAQTRLQQSAPTNGNIYFRIR
jgi:hypothetical protein